MDLRNDPKLRPEELSFVPAKVNYTGRKNSEQEIVTEEQGKPRMVLRGRPLTGHKTDLTAKGLAGHVYQKEDDSLVEQERVSSLVDYALDENDINSVCGEPLDQLTSFASALNQL